MKKFICIFVLTFVSIQPLFANIAASNISPVCDYSALGAYSGTAHLRQKWVPNTIPISWIDNGSAMAVPINSQSCSYSGVLTLPPAPTPPTGYVFVGWKLQNSNPLEDLDLSTENVITYGAKGLDGERCTQGYMDGEDHDIEEHFNCSSSALVNVNFGEGIVVYNSGDKVILSASCNNTVAEMPEPSENLMAAAAAIEEQCSEDWTDECEEQMMALEMQYLNENKSSLTRPVGTFNGTETGSNCWCRVSKYIPSTGDAQNLQAFTWVNHQFYAGEGYEDSNDCAMYCAEGCADFFVWSAELYLMLQ